VSTDLSSSNLESQTSAYLGLNSSVTEVYELRSHLDLCRRANGRWFNVQCGADRIRTFVITRFVSSVTVAFLFVGVGYLLD
jgi:hypothetical protein